MLLTETVIMVFGPPKFLILNYRNICFSYFLVKNKLFISSFAVAIRKRNLVQLFAGFLHPFCVLDHTKYMPPEKKRTSQLFVLLQTMPLGITFLT